MELHPHVKRLIPQVEERHATMIAGGEFDLELARIEKLWPERPLSRRALGPLGRIAMCCEIEMTLAFARNDQAALAKTFRAATDFRSLALRWQVLVPVAENPLANIPLSAWDTVKSTGPAILSRWEEARTCAAAIITAAHLDQQHASAAGRADNWGKGTVDAFLIGLYSAAYGIPTHYEPVRPLVPVYRALLQNWQTPDHETYRQVMSQAAEFHLDCCGHGTDDRRYEFESNVSQIFPFELLVIQALRRRDGLPAFDTGHALVDAPWSLLRDLPIAGPHPASARLSERLCADYPAIR